VGDELEGMLKELVVGIFVSLSSFPKTSDSKHKPPVSRCSWWRGSY
jgi:hypothetical protein